MNVAMMLKNFVAPKPEVPTRPAQSALDAHLKIVTGVRRERSILNSREAAALGDITREERLAAEIKALRDSIDTRLADARYAEAPAADVSEERRTLSVRETEHAAIAEGARIARLMLPRLRSGLEDTATMLKALQEKLPLFLRDALLEAMASHADELAATELRFRDVHRKTFVAAIAADRISMAQGLGQFVSSASYYELRLSKPDHPAFDPSPVSPEESQRLWRENAKAIEAEADALIHALLNGEASA